MPNPPRASSRLSFVKRRSSYRKRAVDFPVFAALGCTLAGKFRFGVLLAGGYFLLFAAAAFAAGWAIF